MQMDGWAAAALLLLLPLRMCLQAAPVFSPALHNAVQAYLHVTMKLTETMEDGRHITDLF